MAAQITPTSTPYAVKWGDTLTRIALDHGFSDWREIYYHPDNAEFRRKRPDPDKIYVGDILMIPDRLPVPPRPPNPPPWTPPNLPPTPPEIEPDGPSVIEAREDDTLCTLAIAAGFQDCLPLRAEPANAEYLDRPLRPGRPGHHPRPLDLA